jgi:hypothetical protein
MTISAISRGGLPATGAAAIAPLHWNWASSGRCDGTTAPYSAERPNAAKALPTILESSSCSDKSAPSVLRELLGSLDNPLNGRIERVLQ